jgi:hypothetical protein
MKRLCGMTMDLCLCLFQRAIVALEGYPFHDDLFADTGTLGWELRENIWCKKWAYVNKKTGCPRFVNSLFYIWLPGKLLLEIRQR